MKIISSLLSAAIAILLIVIIAGISYFAGIPTGEKRATEAFAAGKLTRIGGKVFLSTNILDFNNQMFPDIEFGPEKTSGLEPNIGEKPRLRQPKAGGVPNLPIFYPLSMDYRWVGEEVKIKELSTKILDGLELTKDELEYLKKFEKD